MDPCRPIRGGFVLLLIAILCPPCAVRAAGQRRATNIRISGGLRIVSVSRPVKTLSASQSEFSLEENQ